MIKLKDILNEVSNGNVKETKFGNLRVTIGNTTYEVAYSADGWVNPYGIGVVGNDDYFLKMNNPKAKKLWKQLEPIISKWKQRNESINEVSKPKVIDASYIERNGKLYSIKRDGSKVWIDDIKNELGISIPNKYDERELNKLVPQFKKQGIKFTFDDAMDVS